MLTQPIEDQTFLESADQTFLPIFTSFSSLHNEALSNAVFLVSEYIRKCSESNWTVRLQPLFRVPPLPTLFSGLLTATPPQACASLTVASVLFSSCSTVLFGLTDSERESVLSVCTQTVQVLGTLVATSEAAVMETQIGETYPPLGSVRLAAVEMLAALACLPLQRLGLKICESQALRMATDLFFDYEWHSMLHKAYFSLVKRLLSSPPPETQQRLLTETGLLHHIVATEATVSRGGRCIRAGNYGYVVRISDAILSAAQSSFLLHATLMEVEGWDEFVKQRLVPVLEEERKAQGSDVKRTVVVPFSPMRVDEIGDETPMGGEDEDEDGEFELTEELGEREGDGGEGGGG